MKKSIMKKYLFCLLTMALLVVFCACQSKTESQSTQPPESVIYDVFPTFWCEGYDEYCEKIPQYNFPDSFVTYDALKIFGSFKSLVVISGTLREDGLEYMYTIEDACGFEYGIYVRHGAAEKLTPDDTVFISDVQSDMTTLNTEKSGRLYKNNVQYNYIKGKLSNATWYIDDIEFILCGDSMLGDYPKTGNNVVVKKLLSASDEDLEQAMSAINESLRTAQKAETLGVAG